MKIIELTLSVLLIFTFITPNIFGEESEVYKQTNMNYISLENDKEEIESFILTIDNQEVTVYFENNESYYISQDGGKVILARYYDLDFNTNIDKPVLAFRAQTMGTFLNDFYYVNDSNSSVKLESTILNQSSNIIADFLSSYLLTKLGATWWTGPLLNSALTVVVQAIKSNPHDSWVYYNIKNYKNKSCSAYLSGRTFTVKNNGVMSNLKYDYIWSENPTVGIVNSSCKVINQKYPYWSDGGQ